ncbi:hypothetical protein [Cognatilysobacter lacus]|uniref:Uncharacterized protein n=1 Tax=Cognatilysobacter lacus TaxID=1643323 RepID=A0A5D8YCY8_9GAMM|nr:hypothetical protein [Lysobacter lacus]TZF80575.1 hypothetical protein FW784_13980 [Lysobacter lacus]
MIKFTAAVLVLTSSLAQAAGPPACAVPGKMEHWRADYCLAKVGTDDILAAQSCLETEEKVLFRSACTANLYYKRKICVLNAAAAGTSVEKCVADPAVVGPTVRNGGA